MNASLRRHGEAREKASASDSIHQQSIGRFQLYVKMAISIVTKGLCVIEARDVKIEQVHGVNSSSDSKGEVEMAVKKDKTAREGTREPVNKEEQSQQQASNTREKHVEVQHVEKNGTQCFKSGSNDKWDNNNKKFDQDESNMIVNTDQKGNCFNPMQRISEPG